MISRWVFLCSLAIACVLPSHTATAAGKKEKILSCKSAAATNDLKRAFALQKDGNSEQALKVYKSCLEKEHDCVDCLYEAGWSYWKLGEWKSVISTWEEALKLSPEHPEIPQYLPSAKNNLAAVEAKVYTQGLKRNVDLMITSTPADAPVQLTFTSRWQSYNKEIANPLDRFDVDIDSPKSVNFSPDGKFVYVNSLEGAKTVIFDANGTEKKAVIRYRFGEAESKLFDKKTTLGLKLPIGVTNANFFTGKPVEGEFTHGGRFFWAPYYRRSWDDLGRYPSAMGVIDTKTQTIVRVVKVGPISKYVRVSPDGKTLAVSHWGDNTIGIWNISSSDVKDFKEVERLTVESKMKQSEMTGDRDRHCGFCVRGLAYTNDSRYLFVGRMSGGGIAVFDLSTTPRRYLGTVDGLAPGPRDLQMSPSGEFLYISCNATGAIWKVPIKALLEVATSANGKRKKMIVKTSGAISGFAGLGVRSIKVSPDGSTLFAAVNQTSEVVALRTSDMKLVARIAVDSYPVGLDLSPDGQQLWVTSQGRSNQGGNSVGAFQVRYKNEEVILKSKSPTEIH